MESTELRPMNEEELEKISSSENEKENIETEKQEKESIKQINFHNLNKHDIVVELNNLVHNYDLNYIKDLFEEGLKAYNVIYENDYNKALEVFKETQENEEDFDFYDNTKEQIDLIEKTYRAKRQEIYKAEENKKEYNLKAKYQVIEEIKDLINNTESLNETFKIFKELQKKWHEIGMVPQANLKDLWETYHHHVENFYDYIKINQELRDIDLKKNLEQKNLLCEKAEKLDEHESISEASKILQKLHDQWREIGPVPKEDKEPIWERFKKATEIINKKNYDFFTNLKDEQKDNLKVKENLCEQIEKLCDEFLDSHKKWNTATDKIVELQNKWKESGAAPKKDRNKVFKRFRDACDIFFEKKKEFYFKIKDEQENNLSLKEDLCKKVEELKDSTDWKSTTDKIISIQKEWKKIGSVSRKNSDKVWARFRSACDEFFNNKNKYFSEVDEQHGDNLLKKEEIIKELENFEASEKEEDSINRLKEIQNKWAEIGFVPISVKNEINEKFNNLINTEFDKLNLDSLSLNIQRFRAKIDSYLHGDNTEKKILSEREKLASKIKQAESETTTLENNIGFLSSSSETSKIVDDLKRKISKEKEKIKLLKAKLKVIDELL